MGYSFTVALPMVTLSRGRGANMLRTFTAAAGMGLANMDKDERPNTFLKGLIERLLSPDKKKKLDSNVGGLGLVNNQDLGKSNNIGGDVNAGSTRGVSAEGNDNQVVNDT
jgi:hypothetical protein